MQALIDRALKSWNQREKLKVSYELLEATFLREPAREVFESNGWVTFLKKESEVSRIHWIVRLDTSAHLKQHLNDLSSKFRFSKLVFGGGMNHIFPGIPLLTQAEDCLEVFRPQGPQVLDFEGPLITDPSKKNENIFRCAQNDRERDQLVAFVGKEFPGRWHREILIDREKNFMEHYFCYLSDNEVVGYARLYGWRKDYWAPGVYFSGPGRGQGGLGPIGVANSQRGQGIGSRILSQAWKRLIEKKCESVRVDWTTEKVFYEKAGLHVVQTYQPAEL